MALESVAAATTRPWADHSSALGSKGHKLVALPQILDHSVIGLRKPSASSGLPLVDVKTARASPHASVTEVAVEGDDDEALGERVLGDDGIGLITETDVPNPTYGVSAADQQVDHRLDHVLVAQEA